MGTLRDTTWREKLLLSEIESMKLDMGRLIKLLSSTSEYREFQVGRVESGRSGRVGRWQSVGVSRLVAARACAVDAGGASQRGRRRAGGRLAAGRVESVLRRSSSLGGSRRRRSRAASPCRVATNHTARVHWARADRSVCVCRS